MNILTVSVAGVMAIFTTGALAEAEDSCRDVLVYSARNYSVETADLGVAIKLYDQYCNNDTVRSGTHFDLGLETVIKAVPAKFSLGHGSTEERTSFFCKTFDSDYKRNEKYFRSISQVANETTNAWLTCKTLAGKGVLFRPRIAQTQFVIEVARTNSAPASVEGVVYKSALLSCTVPNTDKDDSTTTADDKTRKALTDAYWPITCVRKPQETGNETIYPKVDISVSTTKGSFLLPVAADAKFPYQWASEIQKQIQDLSAKLDATTTAINARIEGIKLTESNTRTLKEFGCGGQAVSDVPFEFMYGSRDGTSCHVTNTNWVKTIGLEIPPAK